VNAVKMLKADHDRVQALFKEFEAAGERAYEKKRGIAEEVFTELEIHTMLEEEMFYPAVQARADKEGEELIAESLQEHHVVDVLMREIRKLDPGNDAYQAKFQVLMENVEHHIEEEEGEMFPMASEHLADTLDSLGTKMEERKQELQTSGQVGLR
jgi:hemerythrin-like domain-containing protein